MFSSIKEILTLYVRYNLVLFLLVTALFIIGIVTGNIVVNRLSDNQVIELENYIDNFFTYVSAEQALDHYHVFLSSLGYHITLLGVIWVLGITMIGIPVLLLLVFLRGIAFGFTIGFLLEKTAFKGLLMVLLSILPHNILFLPCFFIISVAGISFSILLIKNQLGKKSIMVLPELINYTLLFVIMGIGFVVGSLIEAYISPTFMRLFLEYL